MESQIQSQIEEILSLMGFTQTQVLVEASDSEGYSASITAQPEDSGVLIGYHGEGVDALQLIVNLSTNKNNQEWTRITVNINDYRQQREEVVKNMALSAAQNAKSTGKAVVLNYLPSHERRIAHMILSEDSQIETYSEGVGKYRRLIISPLA